MNIYFSVCGNSREVHSRTLRYCLESLCPLFNTGVCNWRYGTTYSSSLTVEASRHIFPAPMLSPQRLGLLQLRQNPDQCSYNYNTCARKIVILYSRSCPGTAIYSIESNTCGCAVLLCLVCLFDLACFFLSSFSSLI